jgi:hypothetical protein
MVGWRVVCVAIVDAVVVVMGKLTRGTGRFACEDAWLK